jgi:hypothetical protein
MNDQNSMYTENEGRNPFEVYVAYRKKLLQDEQKNMNGIVRIEDHLSWIQGHGEEPLSSFHMVVYQGTRPIYNYHWRADSKQMPTPFVWIYKEPKKTEDEYKAIYRDTELFKTPLLFNFKNAYTEKTQPDVLMVMSCTINTYGLVWIASTKDRHIYHTCYSLPHHGEADVIANMLSVLSASIPPWSEVADVTNEKEASDEDEQEA